MGDGIYDVVVVEMFVEVDGGGEMGDEGVDGFVEVVVLGLVGFFYVYGIFCCNKKWIGCVVCVMGKVWWW